jgi:glycosyltransferase involved in cell wall biosynthesis
MKIVFLCPSFYPSIGGVERHAQEVAERLIAKGHEVNVLCEGAKTETKIIENIRVEYIHFGKPGFIKKFRIWISMLRKVSIFFSADIIHIHDVVFWYYPLRFLLFFKPIFTTFHGYEGVVPPTRKAIFLRRVSALFSKRTIEIGAYIQKWYGTHPTKILYGGSTYIITKPSEYKKEKKTKRFVFVGRLSHDIGVRKYVQFFAFLKMKKIPFKLVVYGNGPMQKAVKKYGIFKGVSENIMQPILDADIVCSSSYLSIIDALSLGKPVIAFYDNPLKKEYIEEFPLHQYIAHGDKAEKVFEEFKKIEMNFDAQKVAEEAQLMFSWDKITKEYIELWGK